MASVSGDHSESRHSRTEYGFLTKLDLDSDDAVSLRCGRCSGPMTLGNGGEVLHQIHVKNINWDELEGTTASTYKLFSGVLFI